MTQNVTAVEARQKFGEMLNRVSLRNEEIVIERSGKPLAKLVPFNKTDTVAVGKLDLRAARGLGKGLWAGEDIDAWLESERAEWD